MPVERESLIGKGFPKLDAWDKAAGNALYIHDIVRPRMLHGAILRSDRAHARIVRIDTSKARALAGVRTVLIAADIENVPFGHGRDNTPLKGEKVRCIRDEIAAVAADTADLAREACGLIEVEYEDLPVVTDANEAMKPGAPLIHENRKDNMPFRYDYSHGDVAVGEAESDIVLEESYSLQYVTHCCLGTSGIIAEFDANDNLTVHSVTQVPFGFKRDIARIVGLLPDKVRVIQVTIGGAFGSKLDIYPYEPICVHLARASGQPVKLVFDRWEEFVASPTRQPTEITLRAGARNDGTLTFRDARLVHDNGGYTSWGATTPFVMMQTFSSLYRVPHVRFECTVVYTNNPYSGSMRGYGNLQSTFAVESMMDALAEKLGMDPLAFRLKNAQKPGEKTGQGLVFRTCGLEDCLKTAAAGAAWSEKRGRNGKNRQEQRYRKGIGMASLLHVGGGAKIYHSDGCGSILKIDDFGVVTLLTGSSEIGQGSETAIAIITAETLGVLLESVRVVNGDTELMPWDVGVHASRTTFVAGNSARRAALKAREKLLAAASDQLDRLADSLDIYDGFVTDAQSGERIVGLDKVIRKLHFGGKNDVVITTDYYEPPSVMQDKYFKGNVSPAYAFGTHVVEVEVDTWTGVVRPVKVTAAHDIGRVINRMGVEGQVQGGVAMGLGYGLSEELKVEEGRVLNPNFQDYRLMTATEMPEVEMHFIETQDSEGPFGAKGIGEAPAICPSPALANAVYDAIGIRFKRLPLTPERVLTAIKQSKATL
jgi:xanthine dehydrogenase molybdenum-binding subunit